MFNFIASLQQRNTVSGIASKFTCIALKTSWVFKLFKLVFLGLEISYTSELEGDGLNVR